MTAATINGLKTIAAIPKPGQQILSVNLSLVDWTEIHALLWQGGNASDSRGFGG